MIAREILKKLRKIEIHTARLANEQLAGGYHSMFKGRGMAFSEVRQYQPGDDVRFIDWNVSARLNEPYVKVFTEEREMTVLLLVDLSASERFGALDRTKLETIAEVSALLAFSAIKNQDRVGLILFTDKIERYVPPKKGKAHVMRVITEILTAEPEGRGTDIGEALHLLGNVARRRAVGFVVSDFLTGGYNHALRVASTRHDIIPVRVRAPHEEELPDVGLALLEDLESGELVEIDTGSPEVRSAYAMRMAKQAAETDRLFRRLRLDHVAVRTDEAYVQPLAELFRRRQARQRGFA